MRQLSYGDGPNQQLPGPKYKVKEYMWAQAFKTGVGTRESLTESGYCGILGPGFDTTRLTFSGTTGQRLSHQNANRSSTTVRKMTHL